MKNKWTLEKVAKKASLYKNRKEFMENDALAYAAAKRHKWTASVCGHMTYLNKPNKYWTEDRVRKEALKFETKIKFNKKSKGAYHAALRLNIYEDVCSHMISEINNYEYRDVYVFEFKDNSAYVGISFNVKKRLTRHLTDKRSPIFKKVKQHIQYKLKILENHIPIKDIPQMEQYYMDLYEKAGWNTLNKYKGGGLGGNKILWNYENCKEKAKLCETREIFRLNYSGAHSASYKNNWLNDFFEKSKYKPNGYWTIKNIQNEALKYKSRYEFQKNCSGGYTASLRKGITNEVCKHMKLHDKVRN